MADRSQTERTRAAARDAEESRASTSRPEGNAHDKRARSGRGWHGDPVGHAAAGRKGGQTVARDREHMAEIGRKGGQTVSRNREHMAEIGRKGGQARGGNKKRD
ncbi:MAG TPA: hypothetical protein VFB21_08415 [Chthonomonadaceae bacterium]|nr:hypothetical protein [Chthonomonadaceae bacterium]